MKKLKPREILFKEGDRDGKLFIVGKGELVRQKKEGAKVRSFGAVPPHSVVGTRALLNGEPHAFTLRAIDPVEVEEIGQENLKKALAKLPDWFSPFLKFLADRAHKLETKNATLDRIHAIPTLLLLCAKFVKHSENATFEIEPMTEALRTINGLDYNATFELLRAFCALGIAELIPGERPKIRFFRKNLPELLYRTLLMRKTEADFPKTLLSANDQAVLTAFLSATKTRGVEEGETATVRLKDFLQTFEKLFPGIKITRRSFLNLAFCGFLSTEPSLADTESLDKIELLCGNRESIKDLVELNRVYPLLDKRLLETMKDA